MGKNNRYRNRNNVGTNSVNNAPPVDNQTQEETPVSNTPEIIADDLTTKNTETTPSSGDDTQVQEVVAEEETVVEEPTASILEVAEPVSDDDKLVTTLKEKLAIFKEKLEGFGNDPKDFANAAKAGSDVTKFVIRQPKPKVLDALLAFFVENKAGVASGIDIMKGSTTLPASEEKAVGVLFNLFGDLANRRVVAINPGFVNGVLRRPEIVNYYNRRKEGIKANR